MNNREKTIMMIQSNLLIGSKSHLTPKDVFMSTKNIIKMLDIDMGLSEYIKIFNDVLAVNDTEIEELSFQVGNR